MNSVKPSTNLKAAFVHPFNLIGLASFGAISGALVDLRPALVGIGLEVGYLAVSTFAPAGSGLNRFIYSRPFGDIRLLGHKTPIEQVSKQTVLPLLRSEIKEQYSTLEFHCKSILNTVDAASQTGAAISDTLAYLLNKFLLFAIRELEFRERLVVLVDEAEAMDPASNGTHRPHLKIVAGSNEPALEEPIPNLIGRAHAGYEAEIQRTAAKQRINTDSDEDGRFADRQTILRRRSRHAERVGNVLQNVRLEMNKIGVKIQSMDEEGLAAAPVQALKDLKGLVVETDSVTRTIEEIEPLEELRISEAA